MKTITIEIPEPGDEEQCFDVVDEDGRRCNGLCFGELLEQITRMALPLSVRKHAYAMRTPEEWKQLADEVAQIQQQRLQNLM